jgi:hypothetical protein
MHQMQVVGLFHAIAASLIRKESLIAVEYEDGWTTVLMWVIGTSESLGFAANCGVFSEFSSL